MIRMVCGTWVKDNGWGLRSNEKTLPKAHQTQGIYCYYSQQLWFKAVQASTSYDFLVKLNQFKTSQNQNILTKSLWYISSFCHHLMIIIFEPEDVESSILKHESWAETIWWKDCAMLKANGGVGDSVGSHPETGHRIFPRSFSEHPDRMSHQENCPAVIKIYLMENISLWTAIWHFAP